jgi:hypothetical protein
MSKTNRRVIVPAIVGISAAALAQFVPGVAMAASPHASHTTSSSGPKTDAAGNAGTHAPAVTDTTGCSNTESSSPDYGCGKVTAQALAVASTFPAGAVPDLSGLSFDITGPIADNDTEYPGAVARVRHGRHWQQQQRRLSRVVLGRHERGGRGDMGGRRAVHHFTRHLDHGVSGSRARPGQHPDPADHGDVPGLHRVSKQLDHPHWLPRHH